MIYDNPTQSKYSYEVCATGTNVDKSLGEFKTVKEARAAIANANLGSGTLVLIEKLTYSPRTTSHSSGVINSCIHDEFEV